MADWTITVIKPLAYATADLTSVLMMVAEAVLMDTSDKSALVTTNCKMNIYFNHF